jgi:hypothetical protein
MPAVSAGIAHHRHSPCFGAAGPASPAIEQESGGVWGWRATLSIRTSRSAGEERDDWIKGGRQKQRKSHGAIENASISDDKCS